MKYLLFALALLAALSLTACGGEDFESAIVGRWEGDSTNGDGTTDASVGETWEFFEDGTVIVIVRTLLDTTSSFAGLYRFEDADTIIVLEDETDPDPGRRDIRMPDDDTLILTAPVSGDQAVLKRVAE